MKNIFTLCIVSLCTFHSYSQVKIDTVNFKMAVERILADYPSKFQNIKAVDSCITFCPLDFYVNGLYYPFCEVSRTYDKEVDYSCTLTWSNYDFHPDNSEKYRQYTDTDSLTMHNFRNEIQKTIEDAIQKTFRSAEISEYNCDVLSNKEFCKEYILRTEVLNNDNEYFEVKLKMITELVKDGSTYYYTTVQFEMNKW